MEGSSERRWTISRFLSVAPKRKGAMNAEDGYVGRNSLCLQDMHVPFLKYSSVTCVTVVVLVTFRMNTRAARIIPASTATVKSANTVSAKVISQVPISRGESFRSSGISRHSPML